MSETEINNIKIEMTDPEKKPVISPIITLLHMFVEHTDEEHQMTVEDIVTYMREHDVEINIKTLRKDIIILQNHGFDIVRIPSRPIKYFMATRAFELTELKLLTDAVASSRFITKKKSRELIRKIGGNASEHQRKELKRNIFAANRVKTENESIYYIVDTVSEAINKGKKIAFRYTEYTSELKKVFRNAEEIYELSPYALFWNDDYYYVVGWSDKHDNVSVFRADRLYKPEILRARARRKPKEFNLEAYSKRIFEMYDGETVSVRLCCRNDLAKYIVDRFGDELKTEAHTATTFEITVDVSLSPTFYAWIFRFGGDIRILSPVEAVNEYSEMLNKAVQMQTL